MEGIAAMSNMHVQVHEAYSSSRLLRGSENMAERGDIPTRNTSMDMQVNEAYTSSRQMRGSETMTEGRCHCCHYKDRCCRHVNK